MKNILLTGFIFLITLLPIISQERMGGNTESAFSKRQLDSAFLEDNASKKGSERANDKIEISPNPVMSSVTLKNVGSVRRVNIYNVLGMLLKSQKTLSDQLTIDVKDLKAGVYIIRIYKSDNSINQFRFVKE
jgi:hypothetical protein